MRVVAGRFLERRGISTRAYQDRQEAFLDPARRLGEDEAMAEKRSARPKGGLDWTAVSAMATAAAAVVALVAYLMPQPPQPGPEPTPSAAQSSPDPAPTSPAPQTSSPPPEPSTPESSTPESRTPELPVPSSTPVAEDPPATLSAVRPAGCDETETALATYRRDAGTTRAGQAAAARQAYHDLMGAGLDAQGAVGTTIRRLAAEFQELNFRLTGMTGGDPNQVIADINADFADLRRLC
ncbi:hypothetical protein [Nonomuraea sp. C10]|uniref:hypothetical protein n=1 Tax=Nonomuraea sp. C10 TaxID=2600577 RepID=UPI0011CE8A7A|nr:hypothetical protein [Nonomuraea sp. C10]TXK41607.1 hypothetical protein FR742_20360 [Nonomuraea sp. C10]